MWQRLSENMQLSSMWLDGSRATARSVHEAIPLFALNRSPASSAQGAISLTELTTTRIPSFNCHCISITWQYFFSPETGKWNNLLCAGASRRMTPRLAARISPQIRADSLHSCSLWMINLKRAAFTPFFDCLCGGMTG